MEPSSSPDLNELSDRLFAARAAGHTIDAAEVADDLSMETAYVVQRMGLTRRLARGEELVGWKLGYTSAVMREQMGVDQPNFGPLTDVMLLESGQAVPAGLLHPRVEPEIGLRFSRDVPAPTTRDEVLGAVSEVLCCLEVVDSVWAGYRFSIEQNTADGSSAAQVVIGPRLAAADLAAVEITLDRNGETVGEGRGADASGHPADGVVWLVDQLARTGEGLGTGQLVITGGLTGAAPLEPGDVVTAVFDGVSSVSVARGG